VTSLRPAHQSSPQDDAARRVAEVGDGMAETSDAEPESSAVRPGSKVAARSAVDARITAWRSSRNAVALGNLAEHVAVRLLPRLDYQVLATQRDLQGGVPNIVGHQTRSNPEDFVVITPDGRLATVNSKAAYTNRSARVTADGNLSAPRMGKGQRDVAYSTSRAELLSPLDGDSFAQVLKVDLVHKLAQVFEIDEDGRLTPVHQPVDVFDDIQVVCENHPERMPAPIGPNSAEEYD